MPSISSYVLDTEALHSYGVNQALRAPSLVEQGMWLCWSVGLHLKIGLLATPAVVIKDAAIYGSWLPVG